jgi:archaellum biogenesis ATPase FlaH
MICREFIKKNDNLEALSTVNNLYIWALLTFLRINIKKNHKKQKKWNQTILKINKQKIPVWRKNL